MSARIDHEGNSPFERAVSELRLEDLEHWASNENGALPLREWVALAEAWRIAQALREHRGNRSATARALGIGRRTLYTKMEKLGLEPAWGVSRPRPDLPETVLAESR